MSISKAIIDEHGGLIDFVSAEGQGAKFYFDLSAIPEQSDEQGDQPTG